MMLKIFPVFVVVLALGAREYVDLNVPGGLAYADHEAVVHLAEETAISWYREAPPQVQRVLRRVFSDKDAWDGRRSARRLRQSAQLDHSSRSGNRRHRGFQRRDRAPQMNQPVEITFVVPAEKTSKSTLHHGRRESPRRQ